MKPSKMDIGFYHTKGMTQPKTLRNTILEAMVLLSENRHSERKARNLAFAGSSSLHFSVMKNVKGSTLKQSE